MVGLDPREASPLTTTSISKRKTMKEILNQKMIKIALIAGRTSKRMMKDMSNHGVASKVLVEPRSSSDIF